MRKVLLVALICVLTVAFSGMCFAGTLPGNGKLSGKHWGFNIIGHPNNHFSGDNSNGRTIMVPLKTANGPTQMSCDADGVVIVDDIEPTYLTEVVGGVRIYFEVCQSCSGFQISDRDALDGKAVIQVPASALNPDGTINFDIYLRVLGKPNTCMNINAYAHDVDQSLFFWAGSANISRKGGKSVFVKANDLFDVWFCQVDTATNECIEGTTAELGVFNDVFEDYFWQILNDGTRIVQVRVYYH